MKKEYTFEESTHTHKLGDKKLRGVTTVLNIVSKPALIPWASRMACEYIKENLKDIKDLDDVLKKAVDAHKKKKEDAGDIGKAVHKAIEKYAKNKEIYLGDNEIVKKSFFNFIEWMESKGAEIIESEKNIYSEELGCAGILDLIILVGNKKIILDIKTGKSIYPREVFLQCGGYDILLKEKIDGYICLNLKKDGTYEYKRTDETEQWKKGFMACLCLSDLTQLASRI